MDQSSFVASIIMYFVFLNASVPLEISESLGSKNEQIFEKFMKNRRVLKCRPPIFVYENGHWYQCVALCELVWMHCVDFLILDLLKRYQRNTAKNGYCSEALCISYFSA